MINHKLYKPEINNNTVLSIMAPTASGKTALAYELYDTGLYELISVDSALIYKDMNIGTAKPTRKELNQYPHHLVNIISPTDTYNVANFVSDVDKHIDEIHSRNKVPILVGGTMMYYMALFDGISSVPNTEPDIRLKVHEWLNVDGIEELYTFLIQSDPITAERLNMADTQRITRAIEVFKQTGKPMSYWQALPKNALANKKDNRNWLGFSVMPDRKWLHTRINTRLEIMWADGFIDEVINLLTQYNLTQNISSMRCVGYRQVIDFLILKGYIELVNNTNGKDLLKITNSCNTFDTKDLSIRGNNQLDEACQDMKNKALYATRQLAKRQYTWLRKLNQYERILSFSDIEEIKQQLKYK